MVPFLKSHLMIISIVGIFVNTVIDDPYHKIKLPVYSHSDFICSI